jgi:peptidoglycan hydrolase-like protein with peptidoglycan-binding domain
VGAVMVGLAAGCSSSPSVSTTSTSPPSTTTAGLSPAAVRALQTALLAVGCYTGRIDGAAGPATTTAVRAFQAAERLRVDGVYGSSTRARLVAAAAAGTKVCSTVPTSTSTTSGSTTTTTGSNSGSGAPTAAVAAINAYEAANGPPAGSWQLTSTQVSGVDPTYVLFRIGPSPGHESTVQGGYGFAHSTGGVWSVVGFGTAEVGCPSAGSHSPLVPSAVLAGFGLSCPAGA